MRGVAHNESYTYRILILEFIYNDRFVLALTQNFHSTPLKAVYCLIQIV